MTTETSVSWRDWVSNDEYFDDLAVLGIGPFHPGGLEATRTLIDARSWRDTRVLDIGAGQGTTMRFLAAEGATVIGVEPSPYMREAARQLGVDPSRILPDVVESLSLDSTFDVIVAEGVLGFVDEPVKHLLRLASNLRAPGELFVSDWEPHDRKSRPTYGFDIRTQLSSDDVARKLSEGGFTCSVQRSSTVASAFSLDEDEALKRATRFFPDAPVETLEVAVRRKLTRMRRALPSDIECERYMLRAVRNETGSVEPD